MHYSHRPPCTPNLPQLPTVPPPLSSGGNKGVESRADATGVLGIFVHTAPGQLLVDAAGTPPAAASASLQLAIRFLGRGVIFRTPRPAITESNVHNREFNY